MILISIVDQFLVELLAMRALNPKYELDRSKVSMCTTYKRVKPYNNIFLAFWLVNNEK